MFPGQGFFAAGRLEASGPLSVYGYGSRLNAGSVSATTNAATITVTGGSGSYTYAWSYVSGSPAVVTSPTSASTTFSRNASAADPANTLTGVYRCTVTDAATSLTATWDVTVRTEHELVI